MGFTSFHFHPRLAEGIRHLGFVKPTPIQAQAIPIVLAGRDVMGLAQTGTGKTAAFVLPMLQRFIDGPRHKVRALILAPTRELAEQIHEVIQALTPYSGVRSMTIYGGVGMNHQVARLRAGVEVAVACPGRLLDHFKERTINVSRLELLVIDEADRMFDMGFLPDLRRVISHLPKKRQTLLFSATMPEEIRKLVKDVQVSPQTVQIGHTAPVHTVEHALYPVPQHLKTGLLLAILARTETGSVLVFTRTKHRAKRLARILNREGYATAELQGNLSQNRRQQSLDGFRDGTYRIMVATDIAARGIDVDLISHVINYDIPDTTDAYTHRIGRTGRMERSGDAYTFITAEDEDTVRAIERVMKRPIERRRLEGFDYHASAPRKENEFAREPRPVAHKPAAQPHAPARGHGAPQARHAHHGHAKPASPHQHHGHAKPAHPQQGQHRSGGAPPSSPRRRRRRLM